MIEVAVITIVLRLVPQLRSEKIVINWYCNTKEEYADQSTQLIVEIFTRGTPVLCHLVPPLGATTGLISDSLAASIFSK